MFYSHTHYNPSFIHPAAHDPLEESTGSPHCEDDLHDWHGEVHGEDQCPSDSHTDYNVTDSLTHIDCHAPSEFHTPSDSHTPTDTHTPDSPTPSDLTPLMSTTWNHLKTAPSPSPSTSEQLIEVSFTLTCKEKNDS